ncbi:hypothetical protein MRX96_031736 [Rhipicephalus microplus]
MEPSRTRLHSAPPASVLLAAESLVFPEDNKKRLVQISPRRVTTGDPTLHRAWLMHCHRRRESAAEQGELLGHLFLSLL